MNNVTEIAVAIIGAVASSGGVAGLIGVKINRKHHSHKIEIAIKVAKLEEKVKAINDNVFPLLNDIKQDIRDIRTHLNTKD